MPGGQLGRADEIAEQHGELTPLRLAHGIAARSGGLSGRVQTLARQLGNRAQQSAAMAERQPQLLQIFVAELRQDIEIDVVGGKGVDELL